MLEPKQDRIVVRNLSPEEVTKGGIILAQISQNNQQPIGEVIAVGPGIRCADGNIYPPDVEVGDHIIYELFGGQLTVRYEGETYIVIREGNVIAGRPRVQ